MLKKLLLILTLFNFNIFCMEAGDHEEWGDKNDEENGQLSTFSINDHILSMNQYNSITDMNNALNTSPLFRTSNLKSREWIDNELMALGGDLVTLTTQDGCLTECYYFKNGKNKVVLVAPGFGGGFDEMMPLVEIFKDYDVMLLDYWGHGSHDATDPSKTKWYRNPADRFFSERFRREHLDILAALEYLNDPEAIQYEEIIGAGNCYSTLVLSKVQGDAEQNSQRAFDKLIFDSCWLSTHSVALKVAHDPYLSFDQIHGNAPWILQKIMNIPYLDSGLLKLGETVLGIDLQEHSILQHLPHISCPILFIHGRADKLVTTEEFQTILDMNNGPRLILTTPFEHSVGRLKGKEIFKFMVDLFINNDDALKIDEYNIRNIIVKQIDRYEPQTEQYNHTQFVAVPREEKFFNVKNTIISFLTLGAALFVCYLLHSSPYNKMVNLDNMPTLK